MMQPPLLALVGVVAAVGLTACSDVDSVQEYRTLQSQVSAEAVRTWSIVPATPDEVHRVVVEGDGRRVELLRASDGLWAPGEGATPTSATLMLEAQNVLLPMPAYRRLAVDASEPAFGLAGTGTTVAVDAGPGRQWRVRLGAPTPTGGGHYAQRDGDPYVYTVVVRVADLAASILTGTQVQSPPDPRLQKILAFEDQTEDTEEVTNPWLAQVLRLDAAPPGATSG